MYIYEQFLWNYVKKSLVTAHFHAIFYRVYCNRMPDHMWCYIAVDPILFCILFEHQRNKLFSVSFSFTINIEKSDFINLFFIFSQYFFNIFKTAASNICMYLSFSPFPIIQNNPGDRHSCKTCSQQCRFHSTSHHL